MKNKPTLTLVKIGGAIIDNQTELVQLLHYFAKIEGHKILVHGGGKSASEMAKKIGLTPLFLNGRRLTDESMLEVVIMTYCGTINKSIVSKLQAFDTNAIGFSGTDANLIRSKKRASETVDFGFVGDVVAVNANVLEMMVTNHLVPVVCAITHDGNGQLLNTNADTIAAEIAIALRPYYDVKLVYIFEKNGVLDDSDDDDSVIESLDFNRYLTLKEQNKIHSGMLPKLENAFHAARFGVPDVSIGSTNLLQNSKMTHTKIYIDNYEY